MAETTIVPTVSRNRGNPSLNIRNDRRTFIKVPVATSANWRMRKISNLCAELSN